MIRKLVGAIVASLLTLTAHAQETPIKFQLDWRFEGPAAFFLLPVAKGQFKAEKLNVTYTSETEPKPGQKTKVREVIKVIDDNHYNLDWYEEHGGHEIKTIEITYTRSSAPPDL